MTLKITTLYASILGLLFVYLSVRTIRNRRRSGNAVGIGSDILLERAVRAHGNFSEYVPLCLLLLGALEWGEAPRILVHLCGVGLIVGRISHAYGISQENEVFKWRVTGMAFTLSILIILSLLNIYYLF
jgi:uncharacterized membrane protein YecN with MAPEG domain